MGGRRRCAWERDGTCLERIGEALGREDREACQSTSGLIGLGGLTSVDVLGGFRENLEKPRRAMACWLLSKKVSDSK